MTDKEWHLQRGKQMALAYRIWAYCEPRGWDCTISEIADALGVSSQRAQKRLLHSGWLGRVRLVSHDTCRDAPTRSFLGGLSRIPPDFRIATGERLL
jgi:hypothetical protein